MSFIFNSEIGIFWLCAIASLLIASIFVIIPFVFKFKNKSACKTSFLSKIAVISMIVGLSVGSIGLYQYYGALEGVEDKAIIKNIADALSGLQQGESVSRDTALGALKTLEPNLPNRGTPWSYLAGVYQHLGLLEAATNAYHQAYRFDPKVLAYATQEAYMVSKTHEGKLPVNIQNNLKKVIMVEPNNQDALNLLAINAYREKNYSMAIQYWQTLLSKAEGLSEQETQVINLMIASAKASLQQ